MQVRRRLRRVTTQQLSYTNTAAMRWKTDGGSNGGTWRKVMNESLLGFQISPQTPRAGASEHQLALPPQKLDVESVTPSVFARRDGG